MRNHKAVSWVTCFQTQRKSWKSSTENGSHVADFTVEGILTFKYKECYFISFCDTGAQIWGTHTQETGVLATTTCWAQEPLKLNSSGTSRNQTDPVPAAQHSEGCALTPTPTGLRMGLTEPLRGAKDLGSHVLALPLYQFFQPPGVFCNLGRRISGQ